MKKSIFLIFNAIIFFIFLVISISSCNRIGSSRVKSVSLDVDRSNVQADIKNSGQCASVGGLWIRLENNEEEACVIAPADTGRECIDDRGCQLFCAAPFGAVTGQLTKGTCSSRAEDRCKMLHVIAGRAKMFCVD